MAVAAARVATRVGTRPTYRGEDQVGIWDLTFSGNFPDEGEAFTAALFSLPAIPKEIIPHGAAVAADGETGLVIAVDYVNSKFIFLESAATGLALLEKTNAEAYPTGLIVRVTVYY